MQYPLFVDMSNWNAAPEDIDWPVYCEWARQWDGLSRVAMKVTEGTSFVDPHWQQYQAGFMRARGDISIYYHYAKPGENTAFSEANFLHSKLGLIRPHDHLMLDYEEEIPQATGKWALAWLRQSAKNYGRGHNMLYASDAYIRERLQDAPALKNYALCLANWQFSPTERPPCPPPWKQYLAVQYSDHIEVPGIPGAVDGDIYMHIGI